MAVVEGCPAFSEGCPFNITDVALLPEVVGTLPKEILEKCPAFKNGCPFKGEDSVEALYNRMSEMPATHRMGEPSPAATLLEQTLHLVHEKSKAMKGKFSQPCPVFATSCPFKTLTSAGEPLVQELDALADRWGLGDVGPVASSQAGVTSAAEAQGQQPAEPLSRCLKSGTKSVHRAAENVQFVRQFLRGAVPLESYLEFLRALYFVYEALERALDALPEHLWHCDFKRLYRSEALLEDLRKLGGEEMSAKPPGSPSPAAKRYVERLTKLSAEEPLLILAHAYTRYLGDLSGGQILARAASKAYNLPEGEGTAFYRFDQVGSTPADIKSFKKAYRSSLDALGLSATEADAMVAEANDAFLLNILLFEERDVASGHLDRVHSLEEISELTRLSPLKFQKAYGGAEAGADAGGSAPSKCPFLPANDARQPKSGSEAAQSSVCPWPFIWLHDPSTAVAAHPLKNIFAAVGLYGFVRAAQRYPRCALAGTVALFTPALLYHRLHAPRSPPRRGAYPSLPDL
eukprot:TRINITY_DN18551_c0_g1_i1.p1 TRINITY_DN18551_c0_g1~~TRINITY_DN18551_c0_g1_i1.p1  ORF type:complete len:538 (+),score=126.76 TRINITY_DN18551_c0_g1_i1:66-1616(+)